jgi:hypothetical protein
LAANSGRFSEFLSTEQPAGNDATVKAGRRQKPHNTKIAPWPSKRRRMISTGCTTTGAAADSEPELLQGMFDVGYFPPKRRHNHQGEQF